MQNIKLNYKKKKVTFRNLFVSYSCELIIYTVIYSSDIANIPIYTYKYK